MRRLVLFLGICFFCASANLYAAVLDQGAKVPSIPSGNAVKVTKMRAAGVVMEISDTALKIERKIKDKAETMEFVLEKALNKIKVGNKVRVSYITREGKNVATKVTADVPNKAINKENRPATKAVPAISVPANK